MEVLTLNMTSAIFVLRGISGTGRPKKPLLIQNYAILNKRQVPSRQKTTLATWHTFIIIIFIIIMFVITTCKEE